jgi:hypothetical protein
VNWRDPRIKTYLYNLLDDPSGPFAFVDAKARTQAKQCIHHRNPSTGDIFPSCGLLSYELPFKQRTIRYAWGRLCTGQSRQRNGSVVDGYGLMWREKRWRRYGGQTSNGYGFTSKFLELAGLVLPHDPVSCSECSDVAPKAKAPGPRRGSPPRPVSASLPLPHVPMQPATSTSMETSPAMPTPVEAPPADPDFETFALIFATERFAKYGDHDAGTVRAEKHIAIASEVLDVTAEACAWAQGRGLELDRSTVREDLCRRIARLWLDMRGTNGFLNERRHPIGLIVGDMPRVAPEALAAWKRSQPKPKALSPEVLELAARAELAGGATAENNAPRAALPRVPVRAARAEAGADHVLLARTGNAVFDRAAEQTRACSPVAFDQWCVGVQFEALTDGVLSLRAQNDFVREWIERRFLSTLTDKIREQTNGAVDVTWAIDPHLSLPLVRFQPVPSTIGEEARADELHDEEPHVEGEEARTDELHDEEPHVEGKEARTDELHDEEPRADELAEEPFTRGAYGTVNVALAEFMRNQAPRRGGSVRTRIALRSRMASAPPEVEGAAESADSVDSVDSAPSQDHPRRRHTRSRLGLSYEQAGPVPPSETAAELPREGDEEEPGPVSKR